MHVSEDKEESLLHTTFHGAKASTQFYRVEVKYRQIAFGFSLIIDFLMLSLEVEKFPIFPRDSITL